MNYLLMYPKIIDQIIENREKQRDLWKKSLNPLSQK